MMSASDNVYFMTYPTSNPRLLNCSHKDMDPQEEIVHPLENGEVIAFLPPPIEHPWPNNPPAPVGPYAHANAIQAIQQLWDQNTEAAQIDPNIVEQVITQLWNHLNATPGHASIEGVGLASYYRTEFNVELFSFSNDDDIAWAQDDCYVALQLARVSDAHQVPRPFMMCQADGYQMDRLFRMDFDVAYPHPLSTIWEMLEGFTWHESVVRVALPNPSPEDGEHELEIFNAYVYAICARAEHVIIVDYNRPANFPEDREWRKAVGRYHEHLLDGIHNLIEIAAEIKEASEPIPDYPDPYAVCGFNTDGMHGPQWIP